MRITRLSGINLNRFIFDMDVTWNGFFTDAELNVYSRYGGRDDGEPEARMSVDSLLRTMDEVLAEHDRKIDSRRFQPTLQGRQTPGDIPLLKANHRGCVRCHIAREYQLLQSFHDKTFTRRELFRFPPPETLGVTVERDHGHRVKSVKSKSAAAAAGVKPGDVITRIGDTPVRSEYDIRFGLDRATRKSFAGQPIAWTVQRPVDTGSPRPLTLTLKPKQGWWTYDIGWKMSLRSAPFRTGMRGYSLAPSQRKDLGLSVETLGVKISSIYSDGFGRSVGLQKRDVVVGIPEPIGRVRLFDTFLGHLLRRHQPGDTVRLTVLRNGKRITVSGKFPEWFTAETSVP